MTYRELKRLVEDTRTDARSDLLAILHRCLNTGLRSDKHRPLYLEVCRVLGVDPDKPWEEK